jgi:hypothetical protein
MPPDPIKSARLDFPFNSNAHVLRSSRPSDWVGFIDEWCPQMDTTVHEIGRVVAVGPNGVTLEFADIPDPRNPRRAATYNYPPAVLDPCDPDDDDDDDDDDDHCNFNANH